MPYLALEHKTENLSDRKSMLIQAIQDQPFSATLWNALSEVYEEKQAYWLAVSAAKRANELSADVPKFMYQLGDSISDVIAHESCQYDETEYRKSAIKLLAKAAKKEPNQLYYDNLSLHYLRIGLFPLAYQNAKQAFELDINPWTATHYAQASLLLQRYDEAAKALAKAKTVLEKDVDLDISAALAWKRGEPEKAIAALNTLNKSQQNLLTKLRVNWLLAINGQQVNHKKLSGVKQENPWQGIVRQFILEEKQEEEFIGLADDGCKATEAYFYMAYQAWIHQDIEKSKAYLKKVSQQPATLYSEYYWAPLILEKI